MMRSPPHQRRLTVWRCERPHGAEVRVGRRFWGGGLSIFRFLEIFGPSFLTLEFLNVRIQLYLEFEVKYANSGWGRGGSTPP
eukprot:5204753-Prymnesium_polylepis.1